METEMKPYIVYVKTDEQNRITAVNSSAFLSDPAGWTAVGSGYGDRFRHAQNNYFEKAIRNERGVWRYSWKNGEVLERTEQEMDGDAASQPAEPETNEVLLLEVAADHEYRICLLELGIDESEVEEHDV